MVHKGRAVQQIVSFSVRTLCECVIVMKSYVSFLSPRVRLLPLSTGCGLRWEMLQKRWTTGVSARMHVAHISCLRAPAQILMHPHEAYAC